MGTPAAAVIIFAVGVTSYGWRQMRWHRLRDAMLWKSTDARYVMV